MDPFVQGGLRRFVAFPAPFRSRGPLTQEMQLLKVFSEHDPTAFSLQKVSR